MFISAVRVGSVKSSVWTIGVAVRGCKVEWSRTGRTYDWSGGVMVSIGVAPGKPDDERS
jgi:hypothetical protein